MIKDINPYIPMYDSSIYIFTMLLIVLCIVLYYIIKTLIGKYHKQKENSREYILNKFKMIDLNNPKQAAYDITKYGKILAINNEEKSHLNKLNNRLFNYKYKKSIQKIDNDTIQLYNILIDTIQGNTKQGK